MAYSNGNNHNEMTLIKRAANGENGAFAELVDLYKDKIHCFILCVIGPDRESEDIAQEVFIQIYRSIKSFRGDSNFSTWAYAITRNVCLHRLRVRKRENALIAHNGDAAVFDIPDSAPGQEMSFESKEAKKQIRLVIDSLSPIHRAVIFLSCWERFSYKEMAEALDVPLGTVRSRMHNAMAALAKKLKPAFNPEHKETKS